MYSVSPQVVLLKRFLLRWFYSGGAREVNELDVGWLAKISVRLDERIYFYLPVTRGLENFLFPLVNHVASFCDVIIKEQV